ncbi:MAG TPA: selenide, water dikinase SelD, partial [Thermoanaerobaculia bacterium]
KIVRNSTAKPGDTLILTKPIGNGILVSAFRALSNKRLRRTEPPDMTEAIRWMTWLNRDAAQVMTQVGVNAATDITGYGLIGHLLEVCVGSRVGAEIHVRDVPVLAGAREYLARGFRPAGTMRNAESFRNRIDVRVDESEYTLLCDAQTSGGLLMSVSPDKIGALEQQFRDGGLFYAKIGKVTEQRTVTLVQ